MVAHGAILRIYEKKPLVADQVAVNYRKADITPRQRAMLDFAMKVCLQSQQIDDADIDALKPHGFDDEDAWDIAAITAFFGLSNRMASFSGMQPNPEFYLMGRVPKPSKSELVAIYLIAAHARIHWAVGLFDLINEDCNDAFQRSIRSSLPLALSVSRYSQPSGPWRTSRMRSPREA